MESDKKSAKEWRKQNKLNKIKALLEISSLNERDRQEVAAFKSGQPLEVESLKTQYSFNGEVDLSTGEPVCKKMKREAESTQSNVDSIHDSSEMGESRPAFSEDEKAELRKLLKARRALLKRTPNFNLNETGRVAQLSVAASDRVPLFCSDIQNLMLYVLRRDTHTLMRWFSLDCVSHISSFQILFIEGAGISDFLKSKEKLTSLSGFPFCLEVIMPAAYGGDLVAEVCSVPLSRNLGKNLKEKFGSLDLALADSKCQLFKVLRTCFSVRKEPEKDADNSREKKLQEESEKKLEGEVQKMLKEEVKEKSENKVEEKLEMNSIEEESRPATDMFPRTQLLLSAWQMIEEGYPIILNAQMKTKFDGFVFSNTCYKEVNNFSPMYGVDCEMCLTSAGLSELTRVSIINEEQKVVYDTLVKPHNKIIDYVTRFSGITEAMMRPVTTRIEDVQKFIQENIEPDAIFVGQSLNFDLVALKILHPYCIDTSVIFNITGDRYRKTKLKNLSSYFLGEEIQNSRSGHCSIEDASSALKLVQLKLSKNVEFGDLVLGGAVDFSCVENMNKDKESQERKPKPRASKKKASLNNESKFPAAQRDVSGFATSLFQHSSTHDRQVTITACPEIVEKYIDYVDPTILSCKVFDGEGFSSQSDSETESGKVTCYVTSETASVTKRVLSEEHLSIYHVRLSQDEGTALLDGDENTIDRINHLVNGLNTPVNGLSIVAFCGRELSCNGVIFARVNKQTSSRLLFKRDGQQC